jgi:hypothetical protein
MPMFGPMRVMCLLLTAVAIQGAWLDVDHTLRDLQLLVRTSSSPPHRLDDCCGSGGGQARSPNGA